MGTADPHAYASYGRIATLGANPYVAAPDDFPNDPVAGAAKPPWTGDPSPYGPLATAEQALVSSVAGGSLSTTVFLLGVVNAFAFLGTGLLLHALARENRQRQLRAALLWTLNPLLLYELVAGAHLDARAGSDRRPRVQLHGRAGGAVLPRAPARRGNASGTARVALAFALAWLLTSPYVLPWYDAVAWGLLALLPWSAFDGLLLARTAVLAVPYVASLPARLPADMEWYVTVLRGQVTPVLTALVGLGFVAAAARGIRRGPRPPRFSQLARGGGGGGEDVPDRPAQRGRRLRDIFVLRLRVDRRTVEVGQLDPDRSPADVHRPYGALDRAALDPAFP